jgi:hypothetical protein
MRQAMPVHCNQDVTKKRHSSQGTPASQACCHCGQEGTSTENAQKGHSLGVSPSPHQDLAFSAKVTTGGLSAPVSMWKTGCLLLWIDGSQGLLSRLYFLTSLLRRLG